MSADSRRTGTSLRSTESAEHAIAKMLQPVAQLMIDHGVQLGQAVEHLKRALVQQASRQDAQKESTESRVALLTGVHRKDVKRLRQPDEQASHLGGTVPVHMAVVTRWISDPRYLNADQTPRALAKTAAKAAPGEPDFSSLVALISKDVGARAVLDELQRLGIAYRTDAGLIQLNEIGFVPKVEDEALALLADNVHDHLAAAVHNVNPARTQLPLLEQSAFSHALSPSQANELHDLARQLWAKALQQFLQAATVAEERSQASNSDDSLHHSVRFGVYFNDYTHHAAPPSAPADLAKRPKKTGALMPANRKLTP